MAVGGGGCAEGGSLEGGADIVAAARIVKGRGGGGIKRAVIPEFIIFPAKFKIDGRTEILFSVPAVVSFISIQLVTDRCCRNKWLFRSSSSRKFWNEAVNLPNFLTSSMLRILFRPIKSVKLYLTVILDGDKYLGHEGYVFR